MMQMLKRHWLNCCTKAMTEPSNPTQYLSIYKCIYIYMHAVQYKYNIHIIIKIYYTYCTNKLTSCADHSVPKETLLLQKLWSFLTSSVGSETRQGSPVDGDPRSIIMSIKWVLRGHQTGYERKQSLPQFDCLRLLVLRHPALNDTVWNGRNPSFW